MNFPDLEPNKNKKVKAKLSYTEHKKSLVVWTWLFDEKSHRDIDEKVLKESQSSNGKYSCNILQSLGLTSKHKSFFLGKSNEDAIECLRKIDCQETKSYIQTIIDYINLVNEEEESIKKRLDTSLDELRMQEEKAVKLSLTMSRKNRLKKISKSVSKPKKIKVFLEIYERNPDVIAETLFRANGICERCQKPAPFSRKSNNTPYLEVHHKIPLSKGGDDSIENVIALCPNCHREMHYGIL